VLVAALSAMYISGRKDFTLSSVVITGAGRLSDMVTRMLRRTAIPVLQVELDAYTVVSQVHASNFKISPSDTQKIEKVVNLVHKHVDVDAILRGLEG
jgi:BioD-like phosphotransacetylase family protein